MAKQTTVRRHKKNFQSFSLYIYKVLKSISNDIGISQKGMKVVNSLVLDMFEQLALAPKPWPCVNRRSSPRQAIKR